MKSISVKFRNVGQLTISYSSPKEHASVQSRDYKVTFLLVGEDHKPTLMTRSKYEAIKKGQNTCGSTLTS